MQQRSSCPMSNAGRTYTHTHTRTQSLQIRDGTWSAVNGADNDTVGRNSTTAKKGDGEFDGILQQSADARDAKLFRGDVRNSVCKV